MKYFLFITLILQSTQILAQSVKAKWSCPETSPETEVEVSFDDLGNLKFNPDVFSSNQNLSSSVLNGCLKKFQENLSSSVTSFKNSECPSSGSDFCYASAEYVSTKAAETLNKSKLIKNISGANAHSVTSPSGRTSSSPEAYLEEKIAKKQIDPKNLSQSFTYQGKTYKVSDFDKVIGDNIENVFMDLNTEESKQYAQNYMLANSSVLNNQAPTAERTAVLNNLNKMFGYIYGERGQEELTKMLECRPEDDLQPIEDILTKITDDKEVAKCAELKPGEFKVFSKENSNYYTTGNYLLRRKDNGDYQAVLNVNFKKGSGSVSSQEMMERSKNCLAMASPFMKGPDGRKIEVSVMTPDEIKALPSDARPNKYDISIEGPQHGTNAASYAESVNCATITHEMFHLLGLCDEYQEDRPQYAQYNWTCRVVTKVPSIMRDLSVYNQAVGSTLNCDCSSNPCKAIMNGPNENIKSLYTSGNINDVTDYQFRNKYCKEEYLSTNQFSQESPDKAVVLLNESSTSLAFESRYLSSINSSPYYSQFRMKVTCQCPAGDRACIAEKNTAVGRIRNPGITGYCPFTAKEKSRQEGARSPGFSAGNNILTIASSPKILSLLQPNHFNKILEGRCGGKSQGYLACAEHAYKGEPCNVPSACQNDSYYLGSPQ